MNSIEAKRVETIPGGADLADPNVADRFDARLGRCYELAASYVAGVFEADTLVHGTIQGEGKPPLRHAWVEIAGDVFEPTSGHRMTADEFAAHFHPTTRVRYGRRDAVTAMLDSGTYGPWDEENR